MPSAARPDLERVLRVFEHGPSMLSDDETDECLGALESSLLTADIGTVHGLDQALILSGSAQGAGDLIMTTLAAHWGSIPVGRLRDLVAIAHENLLDLIRCGQSRHLECASRVVAHARETFVVDRTSRSHRERAAGLRATVVPMLKSGEQPAALDVLADFYDELEALPDAQVDATVLGPLLLNGRGAYSPVVELDQVAALLGRQRELCERWAPRCPADPQPSDTAWQLRVHAAAGRPDLTLGLLDRRYPHDRNADDLDAYVRLLLHAAGDDDGDVRGVVAERLAGLDPVTRPIEALQAARVLGLDEIGCAWLEARERDRLTARVRVEAALFHYRQGRHGACLRSARGPIAGFARAVHADVGGDLGPDRGYAGWARRPHLAGNLLRVTVEARHLDQVDRFVARVRAENPPEARPGPCQIVAFPFGRQLAIHLPYAAIERARTVGAAVSYVHRAPEDDEHLSASARRIVGALRQAMAGWSPAIAEHAARTTERWEVSPEERVIAFRGTNYYHLMLNSIGITLRRYSLDFDNMVVADEFASLRRTVGFVHDAFVEFGDEVRDDPTRYAFVAIAIQHGLSNAIRMMVDRLALPNVRILHACNGMEIFGDRPRRSADDSNRVSQFHCVADVTGHADTPLALRPSPRELRALTAEWDAPSELAASFVDAVDERLERARDLPLGRPGGRRRVLLLGTVLPDLSIPEDRGQVHADIAEWLRHSVSIARRHPELDLVVKPHPDEDRDDIGYFVSERFADLAGDLPPNVTVLPYDCDLVQEAVVSDLTVLWSGTSVLELSLLGIDFVCASSLAELEYPLVQEALTSTEHYERLLIGADLPTPRSQNRRLAMAIVDCITSPPVRERAVAFERPLANGRLRQPVVDIESALAEMQTEGAARMARRITGDAPAVRSPI